MNIAEELRLKPFETLWAPCPPAPGHQCLGRRVSKIRRLSGFVATTDIRAGILRSMDWYRRNLDIYSPQGTPHA